MRAENDEPMKKPLDIPDVIDKAIEAIVEKLKEKETKGTIGDLIKLLQLRDEVAVEKKSKTIRAMWVNECDVTTSDQ
jgi:hypothetical protein